MNIRIDHRNLVRQLLPPRKRQAARLKLLQGFITPLQTLFDDFRSWREDSRMMMNVNSQVRVLEGYLRKKYQEPIQIKIVTFSNGLLTVGLLTEGTTMCPAIGLLAERTMKDVPLKYEQRDQFEDADFVVYIPTHIDRMRIGADIEKYKQVLVTYKIIQK